MAQYKRNAEKLLDIKKVLAVNCFDLSPEFETGEHNHGFWEFVYVDGGKILCNTPKGNIELSHGQMIFHRSGEVHKTVCNGKSSAAIFNIIFDCPSPAMDYFDERVITVSDELMTLLRLLISESSKTYVVSMYPLTMRADAPIGAEQVILNYIEAFLLLLMREDNASENSPLYAAIPDKNMLSSSICEYLKENLREKVTLDMLSERFHFGKVYLCDVFKKNVGTSIMNYYLDLKISEAKRMLRETKLSVSEIAEELGFESQSYFSRCFKSRVGHPPQSFRKMLINNYAVRRK